MDDDHMPYIFIIDLDGTIIGDCTYQCDIYNIENIMKKNSIKIINPNTLIKCYKKKSKLIRPYFLYFLKNAGNSIVYKETLLASTAEQELFIQQNLPDICASIQNRIVSILLNKLKKASKETGIKDICIAGGVSANKGLRKAFTDMGMQLGWNTFIPDFAYCTDNAAMIAITGYYKLLENDFVDLSVSPAARVSW